MRNHWSLVVFTLFVQSAVGSVWCVQAALFWSSGSGGLLHLNFQIIAALCLTLTGMAVAMTHLGKPGDSHHAVKNFKHSWLSREILTTSGFAGFLAAVTVLGHIHPAILQGWVMLGGSLIGGMVIYAMSRVYRLRTVPSWNHAGTPLNFLGSALLLGGLLCTLVLKIMTVLQAVGYNPSGLDDYRNVAIFAVLAGFMVKMLAVGVSPSAVSAPGSYKALQPVMQGCGVALWMVYILSGASPGWQSVLLSLGAISLFVGEVIHRIQFYDTYKRVGL